MGCLENSQIQFKVPVTLLKEIKQDLKLETLENAPPLIKKALECPAKGKIVYLEDLSWMHSRVSNKACFHEWIAQCTILLPRLKEEPRNPELEARCQKLKADQADREYRRMIMNVDSSRKPFTDDSIGSQIRQMNSQLIAVAQFVFSVAAGFLFGFVGIELFVGEQDTGFRLLLGVICALIIALAEIYFLAQQLADVVTPPSSSAPLAPPGSKIHRD